MGELIIVEDQFTFPGRERARICPKCQGKGGTPWHRKTDKNMPPKPHKIPCLTCNGTGELLLPNPAT
jgi:DnaJ-class molecular chaperone